jgi:hypothetical protein
MEIHKNNENGTTLQLFCGEGQTQTPAHPQKTATSDHLQWDCTLLLLLEIGYY